MKFRPLHDRVVVRRVEEDTKTAGGIIIPDTAQEKPQQGEIVAVGDGARDDSGKLIALDVKVGDVVLFGKWSGTEVKIDGEELLIMKESDIMGVREKRPRRPPEPVRFGIPDARRQQPRHVSNQIKTEGAFQHGC
jgi:chaperonin GroES